MLVALLFAISLQGQTPVPEVKDPLGRNNPQSSVYQFLEACHARDYRKALHYLDLRKMTPDRRTKDGPDLAKQLEDLLDNTPFSIATLSRDPEGDQSDGLSSSIERLDTFHVDGQTLELQLERVELKPGLRVWIVSAPSVAMIPRAHQLVAETPFEKALPQELVTLELLDTPVWRWLALFLAAVILWVLTRLIAAALVRIAPAIATLAPPLRLAVGVACFYFAMELAPPSTLARFYMDRGVGLVFALALAWFAAMLVNLIAGRWHDSLDPRTHAVSYSVLPLGRQVIRLSLFLVAILSVLSAWGYNTSAILAGLGVGGLAVALAAQKTIENLFGGMSVIGDRPVLVGDVCRFGDRTGTVMHIGLRSTRIRTPERTIVSVPNAQFASMPLENISGRDKIWFHPTFNLRRDTTSTELQQVLTSFREILAGNPKVETANIPVRLIAAEAFSLDVEVAVYIVTTDYDEFLALQQDLLLKMLQAIEAAGTSLAVPLQETFERPRLDAQV